MAREYIEQRDGSYYIAGTRISLDSIVQVFRRGDSLEMICQNFEPLRLEKTTMRSRTVSPISPKSMLN